MKILQLIDTLNPGGAEKMALNYYKQLKNYPLECYLIATRETGLLAEEIIKEPSFHCLNKRSSFDIIALLKLKKFIDYEEIDIVHAHSSSWFFAVVCKILGCKFKLVWHDHYGNSDYLEKRNIQPLRYFSRYIDGVISVTRQLENWSKKNLKCKNFILLPNFIISEKKRSSTNLLRGTTKYNIGCVANLRPQKDHLNLLEAFNNIKKDYEVSLHLFGKSFQDEYSKYLISKFNEDPNIHYYGEKNEILFNIQNLDIAVLSSKSEGLPLALLEYGEVGLPVVCTDVGECKEVLNSNGMIVEKGNSEKFAQAIKFYLDNPTKRAEDALNFSDRIAEVYSKDNVISLYLKFCNGLC